MWIYQKNLEYPVKIARPNANYAKIIITQFGGPDGELGASMRYLSQRYAMPYRDVAAVMTDIGTEELAHMEIVSTMVHQLTRNLSTDEIIRSGFDTYFVDHTTGVWPQAASGMPFSASTFQSVGDPITDLMEDMAAEQKARTTYDNLIRLIDDPDVLDVLKFLRAREVVHFQRFGESLRLTTDRLDSKNFYAFNPAFDGVGRQGLQITPALCVMDSFQTNRAPRRILRRALFSLFFSFLPLSYLSCHRKSRS